MNTRGNLAINDNQYKLTDLTKKEYLKIMREIGEEMNSSLFPLKKIKYMPHKAYDIFYKYEQLRDKLKEKMYFKNEKWIDRHKIVAVFLHVIVGNVELFEFEMKDEDYKNATLAERHPDIIFSLYFSYIVIESFYNKRYEEDIKNGNLKELIMEPSSTYTQELVKIISNTRDFIKDINNKHINIENIFYLSHLFYHIELASINNINLKVN